MSRVGLTPAVVNFILDRIDSVEQLEILLLLASQQQKLWTASEVARELRSSPRSAKTWMGRLEAMQLALGGENETYRFKSEDEALAALVTSVSAAYATYRVSVIELIFNKPLHKIKGFAQSFKLRGDKEE